jgi:hypothetical protein
MYMRMERSPVQAASSLLVTPTPAPLDDQSHSFLDNAIALFGRIRVWNGSAEIAPSVHPSDVAGARANPWSLTRIVRRCPA